MRRLVRPGVVFAAVLVVVTSAAPAQAACGGVKQAAPAHWHRSYLPPLAIGDSTMLLALPNLANEGFEVNAHGCRQYAEALTLLDALRRSHRLPHLVVVALGADGSVTTGDVEASLHILGRRRVLALVTPRKLGGGSGPDSQVVFGAARRHRGRVEVLDWVSYSSGHGDWFQPDGLHLTFPGAAAFARLLGRALPFAAPPVPRPHCPSAPADSPRLPLAGVSISPATGIVPVASSAPKLNVTLANGNPFAVGGNARLTIGRGKSAVEIAYGCVSAAATGQTKISLALNDAGRLRVALQHRSTVQLVLALVAPAGRSAALTATYVLERPRRRH